MKQCVFKKIFSMTSIKDGTPYKNFQSKGKSGRIFTYCFIDIQGRFR